MGWMKTVLVTACAIASLSEQACALPSSHAHLHNKTHPFEAFGSIASRAYKVPLRILSLGASIMSGTGGDSGSGTGCILSSRPSGGLEGMSDSCYDRDFWYNAPDVTGLSTGDIVNPKTILNKALGGAKPLIDQLATSLFEMQAIQSELDPEDVVDSVGMSILLIRDSVEFMESVVEMGKELEEADKKSFILNLLSSIFLVVSMGGSTLAAAGLTTLGGALVIIGEGAGIGLGIYDMVQTPGAIPLDLFQILLSVKGIRDVGNARKAAKARRGMANGDIFRIGQKVAANLNSISLVNRRAARPRTCTRYA